MSNKNDDFFSEENEARSNWFKFEKVGDSVKGTLVGKTTKAGQDAFPDQIVYELKLEDGGYINVGFSVKKTFIHDRMKNVAFGRIVGFKFVKEVPSKNKGYAPAKSILVFVGDMDPDYVGPDDFEKEFGVSEEDL